MTHRFAKSRRSEIIEQCTLLPGFELHHTTHQMTPHDHHMTITRLSHDHHMTIIYSIVPSISHLRFLIAYSTCTVIKNWSVHTASKPRMTVTWHIASHMTITWHIASHMTVTWPSHPTSYHWTTTKVGRALCLFSRDHDIISIRTKPERWCFACFNQLYIQRLVCTIVAFH